MILNFFFRKLWIESTPTILLKFHPHFHSSPIKIRYGETDQMGVVHHSNYLRYLEVARLEWLQTLGVSYAQMERQGVAMPVIKANLDYKVPACFEDDIIVEIQLVQMPKVRISFAYQIKNQRQELVATAQTDLAFLDAKSRRPIRCPEEFLSLFSPFFD